MPDLSVTRRRALALGAAAGGLTLSARYAGAVRIDITEGNFQPLPIAIPNFFGGADSDNDTATGVTQIITANLKGSGLFLPIDPAAFLEKLAGVDNVPNFPNWRTINAQALVTGRITRQSDGRLKAEFRLWDVLAGQQLAGQQYFTTPDNWRRIAHIISDAIYERLTGEKGYFDTRVVFIDETGPKDRRIKRLAIMDQDGANVRYLTRGDELVLTPRFSPSTQEITYMAYGQGDPRVYLLNIETGQREVVGNFPGMSFAPRFSPDGQQRDHEPAGRLQRQPLHYGLALEVDHAADQHAGHRHRAVLLARRRANLLRIRPRRPPADLRHAGGRRRGAAHQLRRRQLLDAGVVAARRLHRLHQAVGEHVRHRGDEAGRLRRAHPDRGVP